MNSQTNKAISIVKKLNIIVDAKELNIPLLDGFKEEKVNNANVIFIALNDKGYMQQLIVDIPLNNNETFEQRIHNIHQNMKSFMENQSVELKDENISFYKELNNKNFNCKMYLLDIVTKKRIIRQLNTYFIDKKFNNFYQLTVAYGPVEINDKIKQLSQISDLNKDTIVNNLVSMTEIIINNMDYK